MAIELGSQLWRDPAAGGLHCPLSETLRYRNDGRHRACRPQESGAQVRKLLRQEGACGCVFLRGMPPGSGGSVRPMLPPRRRQTAPVPSPASPAAGCPEAAEQPCGGGGDLDVWRTSQDRPTLALPDNGRNLKGYASGSRSRVPLHLSAADLGPICHVSADGSKDEGRGTY